MILLRLKQRREEKVMNKQNFTVSILVEATPEAVFAAVNDVRGWWSGTIEGRTDKLGAEFDYRYKDIHRSTQTITEFVPNKKIVWRVSKSHLQFVKDKAEWDGTEIVFEIGKKNGRTELRFTHVGLLPEVECYGDCSGAWGFLMNDSLRGLIESGRGQPFEKPKALRKAGS